MHVYVLFDVIECMYQCMYCFNGKFDKSRLVFTLMHYSVRKITNFTIVCNPYFWKDIFLIQKRYKYKNEPVTIGEIA